MIALMSAEMWLKSEFFYYSIVPVLLVVGLVALLLLLILLLYRENRRKGLIWLPIVVLVICGGGFLLGDHLFQDFKKDNALITPNIRDREKRFIGYKYYDQSTLAAYQRIQNEAIPSLGIYQAEPVTREIEFLGMAHNSVYFKLGEQYYYLRQAPVFAKQEQAELKGVQYHLTESAFADIGFFTETNNYLEEILLPESQKDLVYESIDGVLPKEFGKNQTAWALPMNQ
ncbi:hypothetical protein [Enterococcus sp.]|uniref:hypothetical protein n=1 Tax=Enterococcus sp. TaxID=35783 RepID=UPI0025C43060|nr:hypothetical protein [Enterococcus sp.]